MGSNNQLAQSGYGAVEIPGGHVMRYSWFRKNYIGETAGENGFSQVVD